MKFKLEEKFVLNEKFILIEDSADLKKIVNDFNTYCNELAKVLGNTDDDKAFKQSLDNIKKLIDNHIAKLVSLSKEEKQVKENKMISVLQAALADLKARDDTPTAEVGKEIMTDISHGLSKIFDEMIEDDTEEVNLNALTKNSSQEEWQKVYNKLALQVNGLTPFWDRYIEVYFNGFESTIKTVWEAVTIEGQELGFIPKLNPFIGFLNALCTIKWFNTAGAYNAVHNWYDHAISFADLADQAWKNHMILGKADFYTKDVDTASTLIRIYYNNYNGVPQITQKLQEILFGKNVKVTSTTKFRTMAEINRSLDDAKLIFGTRLAAKVDNMSMSTAEAIKFMSYIIDAFIPKQPDAENLKAKFGINVTNGTYDSTMIKIFKDSKHLNGAVIPAREVESKLHAIAKRFNVPLPSV